MGCIAAINGEEKEVPLLGKIKLLKWSRETEAAERWRGFCVQEAGWIGRWRIGRSQYGSCCSACGLGFWHESICWVRLPSALAEYIKTAICTVRAAEERGLSSHWLMERSFGRCTIILLRQWQPPGHRFTWLHRLCGAYGRSRDGPCIMIADGCGYSFPYCW